MSQIFSDVQIFGQIFPDVQIFSQIFSDGQIFCQVADVLSTSLHTTSKKYKAWKNLHTDLYTTNLMDKSTKWIAKPTEKGRINYEERLEAIARRYRNNGTNKPKGVSVQTGGTADTNPPDSNNPTLSKKMAHDENEESREHCKKMAWKEPHHANDTEVLNSNSNTDAVELIEMAMPASDELSVYLHFKMIISALIKQLARMYAVGVELTCLHILQVGAQGCLCQWVLCTCVQVPWTWLHY